jgi:DNA-binding transcriptional ArsR family regulator
MAGGKKVSMRRVARTMDRCKLLFFALGDGTRQQIVVLLEQRDAMNVKELAARLPLSRPAVSHHLQVMRHAGLVRLRRHGTENYYSLAIDGALALLKRLIDEVERCED